MRFGPLPLDRAEGAILAHSLIVGDTRLAKGLRLDADILSNLRQAGFTEVIAALPDPDDILEDAAAERLARLLTGTGLRCEAAYAGRCNAIAESPGVLLIDTAKIEAVNRLHESLTIATLAPFAPMTTGDMAATVKIIPFAAPLTALEKAVNALGAEPPLRLARAESFRVGLAQTRLGNLRETVLDKTRDILARRLAFFGLDLRHEQRCPHTQETVAQSLAALRDQGCDFLIVAGASATVDRKDVIPSGIVDAGGQITHFGMPVDPGNLLLLAEWGNIPVIGMPGCARSPKLNGFDWVLARLLCGLKIGPREIAGMGVGGLLSEIPSRPLPRRLRPEDAKQDITALVLAAGLSSRMGADNKLLAELHGKPIVRHAVEAALASHAQQVTVVTGYQSDAIRAALAGLDVHFAVNPNPESGMASSLQAGVKAIADDSSATVVCLGDMPDVKPETINALIASFAPTQGRLIIQPTYQNKRGNPVLWDRRFFEEMAALTGDTGARVLLQRHAEAVFSVPVDDPGILRDIDTAEDLANRRNQAQP